VLQLLSTFFNVLAPVFIIVGLAYAASRRLGFNAQTLSRVSYYLLTPAFVFSLLSTAKIEAALAGRMIMFITLVYAGSTALAFVAARVLKRSPQMTAAYVMIAAFGNVGNFGLPISQFAQGREALLPATVYFLANLVFAFVVCVSAANFNKGNIGRSALQVIKTPALLALPPALLVNFINIPVPAFIVRATDLLAGALVPIMLVTLGAQFATAKIPKVSLDMLLAAGIRLISGPVFAFALVGFFGLPALERNVGLLQASMPAAVLVSIIALENELLPEFVTATVLFSNLASMLTLSAVLALL
jgi:hypothetical protein